MGPKGLPAAPLLRMSRLHLEREAWCDGCSTTLPKGPWQEGAAAPPAKQLPGQRVESVDEVQLEENLVGIVAVRMDPVPGGKHGRFSTQGNSHTNLQG